MPRLFVSPKITPPYQRCVKSRAHWEDINLGHLHKENRHIWSTIAILTQYSALYVHNTTTRWLDGACPTVCLVFGFRFEKPFKLKAKAIRGLLYSLQTIVSWKKDERGLTGKRMFGIYHVKWQDWTIAAYKRVYRLRRPALIPCSSEIVLPLSEQCSRQKPKACERQSLLKFVRGKFICSWSQPAPDRARIMSMSFYLLCPAQRYL